MKLGYYNNKKVLVAGGAGFIGSHLVQHLVNANAQVRVLDNLSTGWIENLKNVRSFIQFQEASITNFDACLEATDQFDIIFHCAAQTSVPQSIEDPLFCFQTNIAGTYNLLEAARQNKVKRVIFSSSSAVYGQQQKVCHEDLACNPTSPYGYSKYMGELLCKQYALFFNLETVSLRYFNVYGPRQSTKGPYAAARAVFQECMQQNKPIILYGDGMQRRDFVPVQRVVEANLRVGMLPANRVSGQSFNVASGNSMSLLELIESLKKEYPLYNQEIQFKPARAGDIQSIVADCTKLSSTIMDFLS